METDLLHTENGIVKFMKLSIVLSTQPASFSALAYKGHIEDNILKIKNFGYDGVELAVRDPQKLDVESLKSILTKIDIPVAAIGTGQAYAEEGLYLTHPDKDIRGKAIARIKSHMVLAESLNTLVIIGLLRGKKETGIDTDKINNWLIEALREVSTCNENVKLAIEPINRYETDIVNTVKSGLDLIENINCKNIGLLLDTFHMNIEEPSITESIKIAKNNLFHFHIADSNRWHPGAGHINFKEVVETLDVVGYDNYVSAEIMPLPDPDTAAKNTIDYMRKL
ncbi:MAG: 5-keto-L-gluconate epimerase [Ignavibacteriaceae bacterium]